MLLYRFIRGSASILYHLLWWPQLEGRENVPAGPFLICPNHRSWFDPPLVSTLIHWRPIGFLAKEELFANPLVRWVFMSCNVRPVRRGVVDRAAFRHVYTLLEHNIPVLVFPEGTRSRTGQMQPPKPGIGRLARQAEVEVLPVYILGSFGVGRAPFRWGRLRVRLGRPISVEEVRSFDDTKDGHRALSRRIMERICDLGDNPVEDRTSAFPELDSKGIGGLRSKKGLG